MKKTIFSTALFLFFSLNMVSIMTNASERKATNQKLIGFSANTQPRGEGIADIFRKVDTAQLRRMIETENQREIELFFRPIAYEIAHYIYLNYKEDFKADSREFPLEVVTLGLFYYSMENNIDFSGQSRMEDAFDCFTSAIGGLIGIGEIQNLYNDFTHGVSPKTILKTMKTMLRRVAGAITIALTVVEFVVCLF